MGGLRVGVDGPVLGLTLIYDAGSRALKAGELGVTALAFAPAERRSVAPVMARDLIAQAAARGRRPRPARRCR
ncbi:MAG: hypothetical protein R3D84_06875 [Paracoccaceae bacterium]